MSRQMLEVTGEFGTTRAARLGLPEASPAAEQEATAVERARQWRRYVNDTVGLPPAVSAVCRTIAVSYTRLAIPIPDDLRLPR
jgi:hypothetical protein